MEVDAAVRYDQYLLAPRLPHELVLRTNSSDSRSDLRASYGKLQSPGSFGSFGATAFSASGGIDYYGCQLEKSPLLIARSSSSIPTSVQILILMLKSLQYVVRNRVRHYDSWQQLLLTSSLSWKIRSSNQCPRSADR